MRAVGLAAVVVAACGTTAGRPQNIASTPEPATTSPPVLSLDPPLRAQAARPSIDFVGLLPDVEAEARWPLGFNDHPIDEPSFAIAGALADPGVDWHSLCERGVQFRHLAKDQDLIAYLKVWCTADTADALYQLGLLRHTNIGGIAMAITPDVARIVVGHGSSADVEGMLMRAHLLDAATVDLIAASYLELGKLDDAVAMTTLASQVDHALNDATRCRRIVRVVASTTGVAQDDAIAQLHELGKVDPNKQDALHPHVPDATCEKLDRDVQCWRAPSLGCASRVGDSAAENLLFAYEAWPEGAASFKEWSRETETAANALPREEAYALVLRSLDREIATSACDHDQLAAIASKISELRAASGAHGVELERLQSQTAQLEGLSLGGCAVALAQMRH